MLARVDTTVIQVEKIAKRYRPDLFLRWPNSDLSDYATVSSSIWN